MNVLLHKIKTRKAIVGIVGIGYVGTTLGMGTSSTGFSTIGFDIDQDKVEKVNAQHTPRFTATTHASTLKNCDIICVCVPTPIYKNKTPDVRPLKDALFNIARYIRKGQLISLESTVAVGSTRNLVLPILQSSDQRPGEDFFLAFSPERIDPGNKKFSLKNTPKIVAGLEQNSLRLARAFYKTFVKKVVLVSSLEVAEMAKLLENTYRFINISFINEVSRYTRKTGINLWETISAAHTKPFGFSVFFPGPGIGGHCIPVDPYYLLHDAKKRGVKLPMIQHAGIVNDQQPATIVRYALTILRQKKRNLKNAKILLVGITYKEDVVDVRESPALLVWNLLERRGLHVSYHDPYVPQWNGKCSEKLSPNLLKNQDLIIITTNHRSINYDMLLKSQKAILDTRGVFSRLARPHLFSI